MSKSLSESAAEILSASLGKASKQATELDNNQYEDDGGVTHKNPAGENNPGAKAANCITPVAKPSAKGDAKSVRVASMAEEEELTDEELDEILESLSEEELEALMEEDGDDMSDEEIDEFLDGLSEEELEALAEEAEQIDELSKKTYAKAAQWAHISGKDDALIRIQNRAAKKFSGDDRFNDQLDGVGKTRVRARLPLKTDKITARASPTYGPGPKQTTKGGKLTKRYNQALKKSFAEDYEEYDQLPELSEEEILEARKAKMKGMVDSSMGSCKEDVDALFNGESLSEEFRTKATTIFEAAVRSRVETIIDQIAEENEKSVAEEIEEIQAALSEQVDEYLNYVVEQWMQENQLAVETGLRAEIAEDFINGLKNLFMEHYIEVPEEKADLVEEMAARVVESEELVEAMVAELDSVTQQLNETKAYEILRRTCEGLTEMQVQKIKSLAESVEFTTDGEYTEKLAVIRESYFPSKIAKQSAPQTVVETQEDHGVSNIMDAYVQAITKQLPK